MVELQNFQQLKNPLPPSAASGAQASAGSYDKSYGAPVLSSFYLMPSSEERTEGETTH